MRLAAVALVSLLGLSEAGEVNLNLRLSRLTDFDEFPCLDYTPEASATPGKVRKKLCRVRVLSLFRSNCFLLLPKRGMGTETLLIRNT